MYDIRIIFLQELDDVEFLDEQEIFYFDENSFGYQVR